MHLGEDTHNKIRNAVMKLRHLEITLSLVNDLDRVLTYFGYNVKDVDLEQMEAKGGRSCINMLLLSDRLLRLMRNT